MDSFDKINYVSCGITIIMLILILTYAFTVKGKTYEKNKKEAQFIITSVEYIDEVHHYSGAYGTRHTNTNRKCCIVAENNTHTQEIRFIVDANAGVFKTDDIITICYGENAMKFTVFVLNDYMLEDVQFNDTATDIEETTEETNNRKE